MKTIHHRQRPDARLAAGGRAEPGEDSVETVDDIIVNIYFWPGGEAAAEEALKIRR